MRHRRGVHDRRDRVEDVVHRQGEAQAHADLGARADHRIIHATAVDARVGPDLDVVPDEAAPHVRNLAVRLAACAGDVAESIAAEHDARVHDDAFPERGPGVQRHARIELRVVTDRDAVTQNAAGADAHVAAELNAGTDDHVRTDLDRLLPGRAAAHDGRGVHTGLPD